MIAGEVAKKNRKLHEIYTQIEKRDKHVYLVSSSKMLGEDGEATVDGIHFTDLGMMRYADLLYPVLQKLINKK